jgi:hypothetical protein
MKDLARTELSNHVSAIRMMPSGMARKPAWDLLGSDKSRSGLVAGACLQAIHNVADRLVRRWRLPKNGRRSFNSRVSSGCVLPKTH